MADLASILKGLNSPDDAIRIPATQAQQSALEHNLPQYMLSLLSHAQDSTQEAGTRQLAIVLLKNSVALDVKEQSLKDELQRKWTSCTAEVRGQVKQQLLGTLGSDSQLVRYTAALAIANLARMELPHGEWPTLMNILLAEAKNPNDGNCEAALTTLGYICEEAIRDDLLRTFLESYTAPLLDAICSGMGRPALPVQYFAANALVNSMEFVSENMSVEGQRTFLLTAVVNSASSASEDRTREKAMECLVKVAYHYYEYLPAYITGIAGVTQRCLENDTDNVAMQALQFWVSICHTERDILNDEAPEGLKNNDYSSTATPMLVPLLLKCLCKQVDDQTEEDWNISNAASKTLMALAETVGDSIVPHVMPFVYENISSADWRKKEAALMAFGCMIPGPEVETISNTVAQAVPGLLAYVADPHPCVADTAGWVLGVVCEDFLDVFTQTPQHMQQLLQAIGPLFSKDTRPALRAAQIVHNISLQLEDEEDDDPQTNEFSPHFETLVALLLANIDREGGRLRLETTEALNALIGAAARDVVPRLEGLIDQVNSRLTGAGQMMAAGTMPVAEAQNYIGLLCGAMCQIVRKLQSAVGRKAPEIMTMMQQILGSQETTVQLEALQCVGAIAVSVGTDFATYLPTVMPALGVGLSNIMDDDLLIAAIGTVGDMVSGMKETFVGHQAYTDVMTCFAAHLKNPDVTSDAKCAVIHCLGDIALNVGRAFIPYITGLMTTLAEMMAEADTLDLKDPDDEEFVVGLNESICHCFTGCFQGLKGDMSPMMVYFPNILTFITASAEKFKSLEYDSLFRALVSLLGDISNVLSNESDPNFIRATKVNLLTPVIDAIVREAETRKGEDFQDTRESGKFARDELIYLNTL